MNPGMKMMLVSNRQNEQGGARNRYENPSRMGGYGRTEYSPYNGGYGAERGNNPSMNYEPQMGGYGGEMRGNRMGGYETENRGGQMRMGKYDIEGQDEEMRMGYDMPESRRYKNGRFAPARGNIDMRGGYEPSMQYGGEHQKHKMQIGFAGGEEYEVMPFSQMTAEKWTRSMEGEDGSKGPHWSMEQVKMLMGQKGVSADPWEFYAAINAVYSDYSKVFKKHGIGDKIDLYVDLAKAFIDDKDAQPDKLARYFQYIVKH